jgi:Virulence protein
MDKKEQNKSGLILYQTEDAKTRLEVRLQDETVWLTQKMMADLFQVAVPTINEHIKNIFAEGELVSGATIRKFLTVQKEGSRAITRERKFYDLCAILTLGYRVRSHRGTQFRMWATNVLRQRLRENYSCKTFVVWYNLN